MDVGEPPGGPRGRGCTLGGGAPPTLVSRVWAPGLHLWRRFFFIYFKKFCGVFRTFGVAQNSPSIFALFQPRIPAAGILPLHVNLVK